MLLQQADINDKMRAILIDWLVEVHLKFKVRRHTNLIPPAAIVAQQLARHAVTSGKDGRLTQC